MEAGAMIRRVHGSSGLRKSNRGMTLIELITVMVVVGILTAIAIPSYRSYVLRANRVDAKSALLSAAGGLERCFTRNNTYVGCVINLPTDVGAGPNYHIEVDPAPANAGQPAGITAQSFAIRAVPLNGQARDTDCATFQLDSLNRRDITGPKRVEDCWGK
jgi:type IV pilus assembly protein PilE